MNYFHKEFKFDFKNVDKIELLVFCKIFPWLLVPVSSAKRVFLLRKEHSHWLSNRRVSRGKLWRHVEAVHCWSEYAAKTDFPPTHFPSITAKVNRPAVEKYCIYSNRNRTFRKYCIYSKLRLIFYASSPPLPYTMTESYIRVLVFSHSSFSLKFLISLLNLLFPP